MIEKKNSSDDCHDWKCHDWKNEKNQVKFKWKKNSNEISSEKNFNWNFKWKRNDLKNKNKNQVKENFKWNCKWKISVIK